MLKQRVIVPLMVVLTAIVSLVPVADIVRDWIELSRVTASTSMDVTTRSFDWIVWEESDGLIRISYVFPNGPGDLAGLRQGDVFYMLDYQQYFQADDLRQVIESVGPGREVHVHVLRDPRTVEANVRLTRHPTLLFPLSPALWSFSLWGFILATFIHVLGLIIAGPLAIRSARARFSLVLIVVSSLWIFANLVRLMLVQWAGPPPAGSTREIMFQAATVVGLVGWLGFPALLIRKVLEDIETRALVRQRAVYLVTFLPLIVLALVTTAGAQMGIGPFSLDRLATPILFYVACYLALAAALILLCYPKTGPDESDVSLWSRAGNAFQLLIATAAALALVGTLPLVESASDRTIGWIVVAGQLLSTLPVILVSLATLRYGRIDRVLARGLTYLTILGLIFFAFVGGMNLIEPFAERFPVSRTVLAGVYVVILLVLFERLARPARSYFTQFFATERERAARILSRFQADLRDFVSMDEVARTAASVVAEAMGARFATVLIRAATEDAWHFGAHHPEPPYLTAQALEQSWSAIESVRGVWAADPELSQAGLDAETAKVLQRSGASILVPVISSDRVEGVIVLGRKRARRSVYNLEDLERLRSVAGQIALASDRLYLIELQKDLVRQTSEAHLAALRAQINPHFLFNALNTIAALIEERPDLAEATVENLAAIFRRTLQAGGQSFVTLDDEIGLVKNYLAVEKARFGEKLQIVIDLPDELATLPVPAFSVQTLVENAVKHGLEGLRDGGSVTIGCLREGDYVAIRVRDTGIGIPALFEEEGGEETGFFGIGLRNIGARLSALYDRTDLLELASRDGEGTTVTLRIPAEAHGAFNEASEKRHDGLDSAVFQ